MRVLQCMTCGLFSVVQWQCRAVADNWTLTSIGLYLACLIRDGLTYRLVASAPGGESRPPVAEAMLAASAGHPMAQSAETGLSPLLMRPLLCQEDLAGVQWWACLLSCEVPGAGLGTGLPQPLVLRFPVRLDP